VIIERSTTVWKILRAGRQTAAWKALTTNTVTVVVGGGRAIRMQLENNGRTEGKLTSQV
jgi:hypothetical protein